LKDKLAQTKGYWFSCSKKVQGMYSDAQYRLWFWQEDSSLSSKLLQEICCPQCQRARGVDDAQQVKTQMSSCCQSTLYQADHSLSQLTILYNAIQDFCAEIAHNVSTRKRKEIVERAAQLDVVVANKLARLRSQEDEWRGEPMLRREELFSISSMRILQLYSLLCNLVN
jgi:ribosomal protein L32E